jgi:hypothetical protein
MQTLTYPDHGDPKFQEKVASLQEYQFFVVPPIAPSATEAEYEAKVKQSCAGFEKMSYQHLMQHYLSQHSPYRGVLLYHGLGVGKTCSSITIAEALLADHNARAGPKVWVILPSALQKSYEEQVFNVAKLLDAEFLKEQCTGDIYRRMVNGTHDAETMKKKILSLIKSRYQMFTYEGFASEVERWKKEKSYEEHISNRVIIVDEAHNLRIQETDKKVAQALLDVAKHGTNNRMVLLSATPMYNETDEIFWLLSILCANDKRKDVLKRLPSLYSSQGTASKSAFALLRQLTSEYVSYIKGTNPFTFAARLSPKDSGIPMYQSEEGWERHVRDGLVPTRLSAYQEDALATFKKSDAVLHQANNICYPAGKKAKVGNKGFFSVFERENDNDPVQVRYLLPREQPLYPHPDKLGKYAPKLQRICDLIRQSEGIVMIYSQFVWSGILPMAVALEHLGFRRHGARNILKNADIVDPPVRYPGVPFPSYCILSGEVEAMGNAKIEDLLKDINDPRNQHGELVKVVLMSPVAGEGLSLKNMREVHVLDPWYHLNRLDQVIGRAIRTCSHVSLPLEERNVSVFLHVAVSDNIESTDLKTYQIAARKAKQMEEVENTIRDMALDCPLLKHVNYFPKNLFGFDVILKSSRGTLVPYHYGDDVNKNPRCADPSGTPDQHSVRRDIYVHLLPTGLQRLKKYITKNRERVFFTLQELQDAVGMHPTVSMSVLVEACKINFLGKLGTLHAHKDGFVVKPVRTPPKALKLQVIGEQERTKEDDVCEKEAIIASQPTSDPYVGKLLIYKSLDSKCWPVFAKKIVQYGARLPTNIAPHVQLLFAEGAFIAASELPRHKNPNKGPYIGFVDIFEATEFKAYLYDHDRSMFRAATSAETEAIKAQRKSVARPDTNEFLFAVLEPHKYIKKPNMPLNNELKIWIPGPAGGKRKGVVCESLRKNETLGHLTDIGVNVEAAKDLTKEQVCFTLGVELQKRDRMFFLPTFKPKQI